MLKQPALVLFSYILAVCIGTLPSSARAADQDGWISLFNGHDLSGWRANLHPDSFTVVDGAIRAHCTSPEHRSHLFYVGDKAEGFVPFKNFELVAECRGEPEANSGIFFHTDDSVRDARMHLAKGYEVNLNGSAKEKQKTGSLYAVVGLDTSPVDETKWFTVRLRVQEKHIQAWINDQPAVDYTEPDDVERPPQRSGRLIDPAGGALALQAHDPDSVYYFRELRVRELEEK